MVSILSSNIEFDKHSPALEQALLMEILPLFHTSEKKVCILLWCVLLTAVKTGWDLDTDPSYSAGHSPFFGGL